MSVDDQDYVDGRSDQTLFLDQDSFFNRSTLVLRLDVMRSIVHDQVISIGRKARPALAGGTGLQLNAQKTRISHTLIPFQGEAGFDFLGFHLRQEQAEKQLAGKRKQEVAPWVKTKPQHDQDKESELHQIAADEPEEEARKPQQPFKEQDPYHAHEDEQHNWPHKRACTRRIGWRGKSLPGRIADILK